MTGLYQLYVLLLFVPILSFILKEPMLKNFMKCTKVLYLNTRSVHEASRARWSKDQALKYTLKASITVYCAKSSVLFFRKYDFSYEKNVEYETNIGDISQISLSSIFFWSSRCLKNHKAVMFSLSSN